MKLDGKKPVNEIEKKILNYLNINGPTYHGDILKSLRLSYKKGQEHLFNLKSKGLIRHTSKPSKIEVSK